MLWMQLTVERREKKEAIFIGRQKHGAREMEINQEKP